MTPPVYLRHNSGMDITSIDVPRETLDGDETYANRDTLDKLDQEKGRNSSPDLAAESIQSEGMGLSVNSDDRSSIIYDRVIYHLPNDMTQVHGWAGAALMLIPACWSAYRVAFDGLAELRRRKGLVELPEFMGADGEGAR